VVAVGLGVGFQIGRDDDRLTLERRDLALRHWQGGTIRLALLSDLHVNLVPDLERARRAIQMAAAERPAAILIAGDHLSTDHPNAFARLDEAIGLLEDTGIPTFAVMGNHDYWLDQPRQVIEAFARSKVRLLRNQSVDLGGVHIAGIDDAVMGMDDVEFLRTGPRHSVVAMLHEPDFVTRLPDHVSLMLGGHSHGGQICLPGVRPRLPRGARTYVSGYYERETVPVYVSRGVGLTGVRMRWNCRPEVTIFELRSA
jgi:hypothetical protein